MNEVERKQFANEVGKAMAEALQDSADMGKCDYCSNPDRRQGHREDHEFVRSLRELANDLKDIRWDFLRRIIQIMGWAMVIWIGSTLWNHGIIEWFNSIMRSK